MEIIEQHQGAVTVLKPLGPLCMDDADIFQKRMMNMLSKNMGRFVVDASAIAFVDSRGLEVLVDVTEHLNQSGQSLKICSLNETLHEVFNLTEIDAMIETYEDSTAAVRSFL